MFLRMMLLLGVLQLRQASVTADVVSPGACDYPTCGGTSGDAVATIANAADIASCAQCGTYNGAIRIASSLPSLAGLENLTAVSGGIEIENTLLSDLDGLDGLRLCYGDLSIQSNEKLASISFKALKTIRGGLTIQTNVALRTIDGFPALTHVSEFVAVTWNPELAEITGLNALTVVGNGVDGVGKLMVRGNAGLARVTGFQKVYHVDGGIDVEGSKFQPLEALTGFRHYRSSLSHSVLHIENLMTPYLPYCAIFENGMNCPGGECKASCGLFDHWLFQAAPVFEIFKSRGFGSPATNCSALAQQGSNVPAPTNFCSWIKCPDFELPQHASANCIPGYGEENTYRTVCYTACAPGYSPVGNMTSVCTIDGVWTDIGSCEAPEAPTESVSTSVSVSAAASWSPTPDVPTTVTPTPTMTPSSTLSATITPTVSVSSSPACDPPACGFGSAHAVALIRSDADARSCGQCPTFYGDIDIRSGVTDLADWGVLASVNGSVRIGGSFLSNLLKLDALQEIQGDLTITDNSQLGDISLFSLAHIRGALTISRNPNLVHITGLNKLSTVIGALTITSNTHLISITGLNALTQVGNKVKGSAMLTVKSNQRLSSIDGFQSVFHVDGGIDVEGRVDAPLESLTGFRHYQSSLAGSELHLESLQTSSLPFCAIWENNMLCPGNQCKAFCTKTGDWKFTPLTAFQKLAARGFGSPETDCQATVDDTTIQVSPPKDFCGWIKCAAFKAKANTTLVGCTPGKYNPTDATVYGSVCQTACETGYVPTGSLNATCTMDGVWFPNDVQCIVPPSEQPSPSPSPALLVESPVASTSGPSGPTGSDVGKIGLGVGIALGVPFIVIGIAVFVRWRRSPRAPADTNGSYAVLPQDSLDFEDDELSIFRSMARDLGAGAPQSDQVNLQLRLRPETESMMGSLIVKKGKQIGQGGFGKVFLGTREDDGTLVAVKTIEIGGVDQDSRRILKEIAVVENEVRLLNTLQHPNIVRYIGTGREENVGCLNIYMEYVEGGSLARFIHKHKRLDEAVTRAYTRQILEGLAYLHSRKIAHRDIKPANVLMSPTPWRDCSYTLKIADFGASKKINDLISVTVEGGHKTVTGTPHFMAPEVVLQSGHGRKADIWSVGATVIEMMTGRPPWADQAPMAVIFRIGTRKDPPPMPDGLGGDGRSFLLGCFVHNPANRPATRDLLAHRWLEACPSESAQPDVMRVDRLLAPALDPIRSPPLTPTTQPRPPSELDEVAIARPLTPTKVVADHASQPQIDGPSSDKEHQQSRVKSEEPISEEPIRTPPLTPAQLARADALTPVLDNVE